ncbi:MAG: hypothetical protein WBA82_08000 [Castellaniella sp.]|uniref:phage neck terminator protein n=1 Tax=Castellaniella sp. TaxID=1955812 RepID=UPI003C721C57
MIHDDFHALFAGLLDEPTVFANENGPRPAKQFSTIEISPSAPHPVEHGQVDGDGNRKSFASRVVEVQIQCYGPGAWGRADALALRIHSEAAQDASESLDIGILSVDRIQDVPALVDKIHYEERTILDLTCHYVGSYVEWTSWIETIQGSLAADGLPSVPITTA